MDWLGCQEGRNYGVVDKCASDCSKVGHADNPACFERCLRDKFETNHCPEDKGGRFFNCLFKEECEGIANENFHECYWDSGSKERCVRALQRERAQEKVRYVSMLIRDGDYQGIRLLAAERAVIMDKVWGDEEDGQWT